MKILFVNKFFYLNGGSERIFFQERNFFLSQGHKVIDFSMMDSRNSFSPFSDFFISNINYYKSGGWLSKIRQGVNFIHSSESVQKISQLVVREQPDIAHLHNIYHQLTPAIIPTLKRYGVKVVMTLHDYKLVCPSYLAMKEGRLCMDCNGKSFLKPLTSNCQGSIAKGLLLCTEALWHELRKSYDAVDLFISPSLFLANLTTKRITANKIRILHNGIDVTKYKPCYTNNGYGLYFGRLSQEKGIETLLNAHAALTNPYPLKIVGTGPLDRELRSSITNAVFLGYKTGLELEDLIANAAFVIVPSECYENCSMVVLESMAYGKPVIGSRVGGIPEQIEDGKTGFLFEMGNVNELAAKIELLSTQPDLGVKMGQAARRKIKNEYSLEDHCEGVLKIYKDVIGRKISRSNLT